MAANLGYDITITRYDEIALKSNRVRSRYERLLVENIEAMLREHRSDYSEITREWGRIFIHTRDASLAEIACRVFGVVSASPTVSCEPTLEAVAETTSRIGEMVISENESFAIKSRRAGIHPFTSREISIVCGDAVLKQLAEKKPRVDLSHPDKRIHVEVRQKKAYVYVETAKGVGGLPLGSQGRMVALISGGIDSPVAAWLMMKRGCEIIPLYMNNDPFSDETTRARAMETISMLQKWSPQKKFKIYEAPHGENLLAFLNNCKPRLTCVLCRRMMYRIAFEVLKREGAHGIITGASLGQVASQTSQNMLAEMYGLEYPIYHPLIGLDKGEITVLAKKIGTYTPSTKPATCCMATPEHPSTSAKLEEILGEEAKIDIRALVETTLGNIRTTQ